MEKPLRVAVVGSGPAGFYAVAQILDGCEPDTQVDLYDRLATPWGLVRAGVAPDHPKIKSVSRIYEKTARQPGFRFFGNVDVGVDVSHAELAAAYHAVLYTVGAARDRRLGIPGEDLPGSHAATEFVAWYNGHPDYTGSTFDLSPRRAVVVGAGNVALDVARMLALTEEELAITDTADHAIAALVAGKVEEIVVLGRRGPAQAAFTNPEVKELALLAGADVVVEEAEMELDPVSEAALADDANARRNVASLRDYAAKAPTGKPRRIVLRFLASPIAIEGDGRVERVRVARNRLVASEDGRLRAEATGEEEVIEAGLVFRSIGYTGAAIPGLPFDARRGTIPTRDGRVIDPESDAVLPGVYAAGWIKRGPSGVIGTNKKCAQETVDQLLADVAAGTLPSPASHPDALLAMLGDRGVQVVDYAGWEAIDAHERALGEPQGRPRVKLVHREELLERAARR